MTTAPPRPFQRLVSIGDSFTEGVGDERPDGSLRGWADLIAPVLAETYANLAIRGKLLGQIIDEQLDVAIALRPDLVTFAGGGNDMLRPGADVATIARFADLTVARLVDARATVVFFTGADPSDHLPFGGKLREQGDKLSIAARGIAERRGARLVDLWSVRDLRDRRFWAADRLHLNAAGHHRVAAEVLDALGVGVPDTWRDPVAPVPEPTRAQDLRYYREFVAPWVKRRLTGRSSGDDRLAKRPDPLGF